MTRKRTMILALAGGALLLAAPLLVAAGKRADGCAMGEGMHRAAMAHFGGHRGHAAKMGALLEELDLTREQKESLHAIFGRAHEETAAAREAVHGGFVDAAKVLAADPTNLAGARAAIEGRQASIDALKTSILASASEAMAVLTPEQRAKLVQHLERHGAAVPE